MKQLRRVVTALVLVAVVQLGFGTPMADASSGGTLTVRPSTVRPGQSVTVCGRGFAYSGPRADRVVSTGIDGLAGPHQRVRPDGSACAVLTYEMFRAPYNRYVPVFLAAQDASGPGLRTDRGRVYLSNAELPFTGSTHLGASVALGVTTVGIGALLTALGRPRRRLL